MSSRLLHIGGKAIAVLLIAIAACCFTANQAIAADYSYKNLETLGLANTGSFHPGEVWSIYFNDYEGRNFYPLVNRPFKSGFSPNRVIANTKYNAFVMKLHSSVEVWDGWIVAFWLPSIYSSSYGGLWNYFNSGNSLSSDFSFKTQNLTAADTAVCAVCPPAGTKMIGTTISGNDIAWDYDKYEYADGSSWIWLDVQSGLSPICSWGRGEQMTVEILYTDNTDFTSTSDDGDIVTPVFSNAQGYAATTDNGFIAAVLGRIESSLKGLANEMINQNANSDSNWENITDAQETTNDMLKTMQTTLDTISSRIGVTNSRLNNINTRINDAKTAITDAIGDGVDSIVSAIGDMDIGVEIPGLPTFGQSQFGNGYGYGSISSSTKVQFENLLNSKAPFGYYNAITQSLQNLYSVQVTHNYRVTVPLPYAGQTEIDFGLWLEQTTGQDTNRTLAQMLRTIISTMIGLSMLFASAFIAYRTFLGAE